MNYEKTIDFQGDFNKAAEVVKNTLLPHGFEITNTYDNSIELEGTHSFVNKGADPLTGISWIHIQKTNNSLIVKAEFEGIKKTIKFITIIDFFGIIFTIALLLEVFSKQNAQAEKYLILLLIIIPLPIVPFILAKSMKSRTIKAVDTLLNNMIASGQ